MDKIKVTYADVINIVACVSEFVGNKEAKQAIPESGKVVYAFTKMRKGLLKLHQEILEKQGDINDAVREAIKDLDEGKEKQDILKTNKADILKLFDTEVEVEVHKIDLNVAEKVSQYLSNEFASYVLFEHLVRE